MSRDAVPLESARRAVDCEETGVSFRLPSPFDRRLNQLRDLLAAAGFPADRKTVLTALIYAAPTDSSELLDIVMRSRTAAVREVVLGAEGDGDVVSIPRPTVGRPRRRA